MKLGKFFVICSVRVVIFVVKAGMFCRSQSLFSSTNSVNTGNKTDFVCAVFDHIFVVTLLQFVEKPVSENASHVVRCRLTSSFGTWSLRSTCVQFASTYVTWLRVELVLLLIILLTVLRSIDC